MKYGHPLDIAEAVTRPLTPEEIEESTCRQCSATMGNDEPGVLEPTPFCHVCAQGALVTLAEHVQGKYIDRQLDRLATDPGEKMPRIPGRAVDLMRTRGPRGARRKR